MLRVTHRVMGRRVWAMALGAALLSCAAPTLPLPPPVAPSVTAVGTDRYLLRSDRGAEPRAIVVIYNNDPAVPPNDRVDAAEADNEGSWEKTITAKPGTSIDVWQESGSTRSPPVTIHLPQQ